MLGDFTGDGKLDVATTGRNQLSVLSGNGDGTFASAVNSAVGWGSLGVAAGDFDGDGWLDAATANSGGGDVSVLINDRAWAPADRAVRLINDVTVTEGNTGSASATFTLTPVGRLARHHGPLRDGERQRQPAATTRPRRGT